MTFRTGHIASLLFLALLVSCNKEAGGGPEPQGSAMPIALTAGLADTKGQAETTTLSLQTSGLGLFVWRTDAGTYFNGEEPYLENQEFSYDGASSTWKSADVWWPLGSWLSFFAYAPYMADVSVDAPLQYPSDDYTGSGFPRILFSPDAIASNQIDFCLSAPVLDSNSSENSGQVSLTLSHVLTRIKVQARWTGTVGQIGTIEDNDYSIRIESLRFQNVLTSNRLTYKRNGYQWDAPTAAELETLARGHSYTMSTENGCLNSTGLTLSPTYTTAFMEMGDVYMYLLPQALIPDAKIVVSYGVYDSGGDRLPGSPVTVEYNIGSLEQYIWPSGYEVTYSITIDLEGRSVVDAEVSFNCNAGTFVSPGEVDFGSSDAGSFLGGSFDLDNTSPGSFTGNGDSYPGSSAGGFIE